MKKLYTAVGRTQVNGNKDGRYPLVILNNREYILDLHEFTLWTILNWKILTEAEANICYKKKQTELGCLSSCSFDACMYRMIQRGLVAEGAGETAEDALYNLLSELCIIPISENLLLRAVSFIRLTLFHGVPFSVTRRIFSKDRRTPDEKKVMHLANQASLSTAEIIKCVESNALDFANEEQLMDMLYHDDMTTCDNIAEVTRNLPASRSVLTSIANLFLRKQIIFERL